MGPRSCALDSYEDPWRASAFVSALTQLLLTVLVLVHTIIVCITCQLMKWYGWGYPSCHDGEYQPDATQRFASFVAKKSFNLDYSSSRSSPLINTHKFLKRTRSEDFQAVKGRSFVCPKCHGMWSLKQGLSFRYRKGATSKFRETPIPSDADSLSIGNVSQVEAGVTSNSACGSKASIVNKLAHHRNSCFEPSDSTQKFLKSDSGSKAFNAVDETGHGMQELETVSLIEDNCDISGDTESCSNTPAHGLTGLAKEEALEGNVLRGRLEEEVGSSSKEPMGNGLHRVSSKGTGSEISLESLEESPHLQKETPKEVADEFLSAVLRKKVDCNDYDSESVIKGLKAAVFKEQKKLCALYAELEVERISSETAANEAMSMISRLQEEKAALRMQTAHYRRIAEERAIYDEQAMQLLKDILIKKEKENFLLEKQVKAMRTKFCRDPGKFGMRRQRSESRSFSAEGQGMLLLKNDEQADGVHECGTKSSESVGKLPSSSCIADVQPFKRLKSIMDHKNVGSDIMELDSGTVHSHLSSQSAVSGGSKRTHNYGRYHSFRCQQTAAAHSPNDGADVFDIGLLTEDMPKVSEDKHLLSHHGKLSDPFEDMDKSPDGLLVPSTLPTAANLVQELNSSPSGCTDNQASLVHITKDYIAENAYKVDKSGDCSEKEKEIVFSDNGVHLDVDSVASCYSDQVTVTAFAKETQDLTNMQFPNMVLECGTRKDLQVNVQARQVNKVSWSCPSSQNPKGSGFNNFEESDSPSLWSHVH